MLFVFFKKKQTNKTIKHLHCCFDDAKCAVAQQNFKPDCFVNQTQHGEPAQPHLSAADYIINREQPPSAEVLFRASLGWKESLASQTYVDK